MMNIIEQIKSRRSVRTYADRSKLIIGYGIYRILQNILGRNIILIGEIVNVTADKSVVTDGKIDIKKLKPIAYDPTSNSYVTLGNVVGKAFSDGLKLK